MGTDVVLRVVDQFSKPLDDYASKTGQAEQASDKLATGLAGSDSASKRMASSLTELQSGISLAREGFQAAGQGVKFLQSAYENVIAPTVQYADEVRKLQRNIGATAEESSKLIQAADDVFISTSQLTTGLQAAIRKGFEPSIEGIGKLSDQYLAIQDPIARTKFLMDTFGRSGADLAPLMMKGSEGIKELGESAKQTGLVLSEQDVAATLKLKEATDRLDDSINGLKTSIGMGLIPPLTELANMVGNVVTAEMLLNDAQQKGLIGNEERMRRQVAVIFGFENESKAVYDLTAQLKAYDLVTGASRGVQHDFTSEVKGGKDVIEDLSGKSLPGAVRAFREVDVVMHDNTTSAALLKQGYADLSTVIAGELGQANKEYYADQKDLGAQIVETQTKIDKLKAAQGAIIPSTLDLTDASANLTIAQYNAQVASGKLADALKKQSENTDPDKTLEMEAAVAKAGLALQTAQGDVDGWSTKIDEAGEVHTANYTKQIGTLETTLGGLNAAYDANAKAHEDATHRILFGMLEQQFMIGGISEKEGLALAEVGKRWGLLDKDTATALAGMNGAITTFNNDGNVQHFADMFTGSHDVYYHVHVDGIPSGGIDPAAGDAGINNWTPPVTTPPPPTPPPPPGGGPGTPPPPPTPPPFVPPPGMNGQTSITQNFYNAPAGSSATYLQTAMAVAGAF